MKTDKKELVVKKAIEAAAKLTGKHPSMVTKRDLKGQVSDWTFKQIGGLKLIQEKYFPFEEKDLVFITDTQKQLTYQNKLEKQLGQQLSFEDKLSKVLDGLTLPKVKKPKKLKKQSKKEMVEFVGSLNDTHLGLILDPEEIGNLNSFDFKEGGRRFAFYVKQLVGYKKHKRDQVSKLHLILNGDLIAGLIHGLDTKMIHLMIHQMNGALHIFTHALMHLLTEYNEIQIHGIAGNHDRGIHKGHGQRPVGEIYDSYANIIFYALSAAFKDNPNIGFNFPKTPYGFIDLPAGRMMYAHGDHIFSKALGNPGSTINVKSLTNAIRDFNAGEVTKGNKPVKLLLFGHTHTYAHFITSDGVEVYVAPSLVGLDQFAHSLTLNNNFAAQVIFESTKDYILGDSRLIRVTQADNDESLDEIIPIYKKELAWKSK